MSASADISVKQIDDFRIDFGIPPLSVGVTALPTITIGKLTAGIDPLTINKLTAGLDPITVNKLSAAVDPLSIGITQLPKIQIGLDPVQLNLGPIEFNLSVKEIPSVRVHLPLHFGFGLKVLGHDVLSAKVAGEAQVITEPYEPNACEHCDGHGKKAKAKLP